MECLNTVNILIGGVMTVISVLLILFFGFASSIKIWGWQKLIFSIQLSFFNSYGLSRRHMFMVGWLELTSSLALLWSLVFANEMINVAGAIGIAFTSLGAIFFHLRFDTAKDAIAAILTLTLSSSLIVMALA